MDDHVQTQRRPASQKSADTAGRQQRTVGRGMVHDRASINRSLAESLNGSANSHSLLQMHQALGDGPRVRSQLTLQRALSRADVAPTQSGAPQHGNPPVQKPNATGLPDGLKVGIEHLSGLSMDDVRVHYNSPKPATVQAHAYAQGTEIHIAPGQEQHLPHEAWHVVQQKQGRVKPTLQLKGIAINDDAALEREASVKGDLAASAPAVGLTSPDTPFAAQSSTRPILQGFFTVVVEGKSVEVKKDNFEAQLNGVPLFEAKAKAWMPEFEKAKDDAKKKADVEAKAKNDLAGALGDGDEATRDALWDLAKGPQLQAAFGSWKEAWDHARKAARESVFVVPGQKDGDDEADAKSQALSASQQEQIDSTERKKHEAGALDLDTWVESLMRDFPFASYTYVALGGSAEVLAAYLRIKAARARAQSRRQVKSDLKLAGATASAARPQTEGPSAPAVLGLSLVQIPISKLKEEFGKQPKLDGNQLKMMGAYFDRYLHQVPKRANVVILDVSDSGAALSAARQIVQSLKYSEVDIKHWPDATKDAARYAKVVEQNIGPSSRDSGPGWFASMVKAKAIKTKMRAVPEVNTDTVMKGRAPKTLYAPLFPASASAPPAGFRLRHRQELINDFASYLYLIATQAKKNTAAAGIVDHKSDVAGTATNNAAAGAGGIGDHKSGAAGIATNNAAAGPLKNTAAADKQD